ncbi:MAG: polysaccharide biosynthesis tyrosine autokinase [Acidobacteriota bacterium]|nr:polysaccharide biosynthesis tyrosine autokinase [Blastocatellia bacterium]MDW8239308.1 polysaccharide biosynthesis tyrosine autokinase [Acidobacteriota bacterium]
MSQQDERSYLPAPVHDEREPVTRFYAADWYRHATTAQRDVHLLDYWRILKKRKWIGLGALLVVVTVTAIRMYQAQAIYVASGKVIINQQMPIRLANDQEGTIVAANDAQYLETQLNVLRSKALARRVIDELALARRPEFADLAGVADPTLRDKLMLDRFLGGLDVSLLRNTRIVQVNYASPDPQQAALVVNTLMEQLIKYTIDARLESTRQARAWLNERLTKLQQDLEEQREKLVQYGKENQIVEVGENQTIAIERLMDLNRRLVEAEADRIQAEALYNLSKKASADTLPVVMADPMVQVLRQRIAEDQRRLIELEKRFTNEWPEVKTLKSQIEESERQLQEAKQRILAKVEADYKTALAREQKLREELARQREETVRQNEQAARLSIQKQQVEASAQVYGGLLQKLNDVDLLSTLETTNIQILDRAQPPTVPARPRKLFNIGVSALVGLLVGILLSLFVEYLDNTVKSTEDVDRLLGLPSLGVVPALESLERKGRLSLPRLHSSRQSSGPILIVDDHHRLSFGEAFRSLRTSVLLSNAERPPRTILFTSSSPGEGKTTTAVNMALSLAQTGARVIVVDGDLRKPGLHKMFRMKNQHGLCTYLTQAVDLGSVIEHNRFENLSVIPSGPIPPNPSELLSSSKMREAITLLSQQYDFVVIDSPPVSTPDALILSTMVDGVIMVIRCGRTPRDLVHRAKQSLDDVNAKIFGVVLNRVDVNQDGYYHYYRYYYYYSDQQAEETPPAVT